MWQPTELSRVDGRSWLSRPTFWSLGFGAVHIQLAADGADTSTLVAAGYSGETHWTAAQRFAVASRDTKN